MDNSYFYSLFIIILLLFLYFVTYGKKYTFSYYVNSVIENTIGLPQATNNQSQASSNIIEITNIKQN